MDIDVISEPQLKEPIMIAAWPGMGFLAKISADFLRCRLEADKFVEIRCPQNVTIYKDSLAKLLSVRHRFFCVPDKNLIICVGDSQPSSPKEAINLAEQVIDIAEKYNVKMIYTMAAYPSDYPDTPKVYGVYNNRKLKERLEAYGIEFLEGEGAVNGLNGIIIGIAKNRGIDGVCLMGEIKYTNIPQHLSSKAVLDKLSALLEFDLDTSQLIKRAEKINASIRMSLGEHENYAEYERNDEKNIRYIS
ncbi:hypothetical protein CL673_06615 [Candidatus Bathyarchaeota archaeon]|jgi:hypothetical protein|nr:hypothetical protein [Candidatus Bathyarchaeota archaeon]MDP6049291.1 PAC2 family protein [Candidatus Bathyarchaeota archaeon]